MFAKPSDLNQHKKCCDPFKCHEQNKSQGLREVSAETRIKHPSLQFKLGDKICTPCRKKVLKLSHLTLDVPSTSMEVSEDDVEPEINAASDDENEAYASCDVFESPEYHLTVLNESLQILGESPIVKKKTYSRVNYTEHKATAICTSVKRKLELITGKPILQSEKDTRYVAKKMMMKVK